MIANVSADATLNWDLLLFPSICFYMH